LKETSPTPRLNASQAVATDASKRLVSVANTGVGSNVLAESPSLSTPSLGVATAASVNKVTVTQPATGSTLTIADGKTLSTSATITLAGTDGKTFTLNKNLALDGVDGTEDAVLTIPAALNYAANTVLYTFS